MNSTSLPTINLPQPKLKRTKVKVSADMLPMFATICPARIVGSEQSDGLVVLVLEAEKLPDTEWSTIYVENDGRKSTISIKPVVG